MCVCLFVCVFVPTEASGTGVVSPRCLNRLEELRHGKLHELLFESTRRAVREKKPLEVFHQVRAKSHADTVTFPLTKSRMNLAHFNKPLKHSRRVIVEGHALNLTGIMVAIALREWAIDT